MGADWCKWKPNSLLCPGTSPKIPRFYLWCDKRHCSTFHRPLAVDWWEHPTSSDLLTAGRGPVTRARSGSCCYQKQQRASLGSVTAHLLFSCPLLSYLQISVTMNTQTSVTNESAVAIESKMNAWVKPSASVSLKRKQEREETRHVSTWRTVLSA